MGVMRGMLPLQVIRYLRDGGVVERLDGEMRVETKPQTPPKKRKINFGIQFNCTSF